MAGVDIRHLNKAFGETRVIDDVSLAVAHGEFVALVGPSGSGKSTLLRLVAGLEDADSGEIAIGERVVNDVPAKARDIAMVFQNYALYPHMTVAQNLGFGLRMRRVPRAEIDARVAEVARALDLSALLGRYPRELSGGQRQRVATGRAIVRQPQVFLFDEPLSNLDAKLRVQVRAELRALHRQIGVTSIYVTHDQVEAMTMADRIVVLNAGRVEQVGPPLELYDRPANLFVATFIGSPAMNLLVARRAGDAALLVDGTRLPIRPSCGVADGAAMTIGVRPEHVGLATGDGLAMTLSALEQTGAETLAMGVAAGASITALLRERVAAAPGAVLPLHLPPRHHRYFDADGRRVEDVAVRAAQEDRAA